MRYDIADSYESIANPAHRYVGIKEIQGVRLCHVQDGGSVNARGRSPQSRYGPAAPGRVNRMSFSAGCSRGVSSRRPSSAVPG
jgi:hypothetical protein